MLGEIDCAACQHLLLTRRPAAAKCRPATAAASLTAGVAASTCAGFTFAAWTLTAFAIGCLADVLIHRVVLAIVATLPLAPFGKPSATTVARCLTQHGYTHWTRYQPVSRFWPSSRSRTAG
ncbi:MAG: hypothetical protein ABR571_13805 [Jatrophihabitans sp.]|uniref:hypothetical protein n=1 Tax=Jatrophihabitans sp. TaxID=1932789 RepID=UPI00391036FE